MKKITIFIILFKLISTGLLGQITINQNDMPAAGDTLRYSLTVNPHQFDFTQTGENFQWDFSTLTHQAQGLEEYQLVSSINYLMALLFFGMDAIATSAIDDLPLDEFEIDVDGVYSVFSKSTAQYTLDGFFVMIDGNALPLKYSDADEIYSFPLNYADQDSTTFFGTTNLGDTLSLTKQGYRVNEADGWGNIITPYGEFDVLRLKSIIYESDSLFWQSLGDPFVLKRTTTRYSWLAKNEKIPILQVSYVAIEGSEDNPSVTIKYRDIYREPSDEPTGVDLVDDQKNDPVIYFSGNGNFLHIAYRNITGNIRIFDISGRLLAERRNIFLNNFQLNSSEFYPGIYIIQIQSENPETRDYNIKVIKP